MTVHNFAHQTAISFPALHLVEEINHRVVNEFSEAIVALSTVADDGAGPAQDAIYRAMSRLSAHAEAHRALQPPTSTRPVNLADHIGRLCASLANATLADNCVYLAVDSDEIWLEASQCWRIGLIVAELVRNAARHGLAGGPGVVKVRLVERPNSIDCIVSDNGGAATAGTPGRGLQLVRAIADELGGSVATRFTPAGGVACLRLPAMAA
jgi:two-component sensor histidine kinase